MKLGSVSLRWLMLAVGLVALLLPALAVLLVEAFDLYLVQETERRLMGQGVVIGQVYRRAYLTELGRAPGDARPPGKQHLKYTPYPTRIESLDELTEPFPEDLAPQQHGDNAAWRAGKTLDPLLRDAQVYNLSGARILDERGCVVSTTNSQAGQCLARLPEVGDALAGRYRPVLRARVSDEPPPPFGSISRRGQVRVFSALPVFDDGGVIGVVLQSRTSETAEEWLWRQRRDLLYWGLAVLLLGSALFVGFSRIIERPLRSMSRAAEAIAEGKPPEEPLRGISGPKEVQILAEALANMSEKLEHRSHYIQDFVATVSHELKSPLTSIRGAAELLVEQWETIPDEKRQLFLENIQAAAERTTRLAQRLLALAREENPGQHSPLERVRLDAIRRGILERYPEHVRVEVRRPDASRDLAPERLDTVLGNLLDNALRYRASKPVLLSLDVDQTERLVIEVENDGPPISAANQERLFQRFFTTERDRGGTGLGLAMVKAIAEASGGSVDVQSNSQRTRFQVLL